MLCRFGYMLIPDPAAALAEARRVLRRGGRLVLAVWGAAERNPFFTTMAHTLIEMGAIAPPDPSGPGIFALADPDQLTALLAAAGFTTMRTEEVPVRFTVRDAADYVAITADTAGPIGLALQGLPPPDRDRLTERLAASISRFATGDGFEIPGAARCAVAS